MKIKTYFPKTAPVIGQPFKALVDNCILRKKPNPVQIKEVLASIPKITIDDGTMVHKGWWCIYKGKLDILLFTDECGYSVDHDLGIDEILSGYYSDPLKHMKQMSKKFGVPFDTIYFN